MARARAAFADARRAHLKGTTWRRYGKSVKALVEFATAVSGAPPTGPPFERQLLRDWVGDMVARGVVSAAVYVSAVTKANVRAGGPPLRDDPAIQEALVGWARTRPPVHKKAPLTAAMVAAQAAGSGARTLVELRDTALLAVGRAGAWRGPSELLAAQLPLHRVAGHGAEVEVHTKTDHGRYDVTRRAVPAAAAVGPSPLGALRAYLARSGHTSGYVFRGVAGGAATARSTCRPVSATTLAALVKRTAAAQGFDPSAFATHSLRHGFADDAKRSGVSEADGMAAGGWRSARAYRGYGGEQARAIAAGRSVAAWNAAASAPNQATPLLSRACRARKLLQLARAPSDRGDGVQPSRGAAVKADGRGESPFPLRQLKLEEGNDIPP